MQDVIGTDQLSAIWCKPAGEGLGVMLGVTRVTIGEILVICVGK